MRGIFSTYSGLSRPVYFLFASRVINSAGSFIFPFLTLFLTQKLGFGEAAAGRFLLVITTFGLAALGSALLERVHRPEPALPGPSAAIHRTRDGDPCSPAAGA